MALLDIRDLHVEVRGNMVLKGVSLSIGDGEVHVLMGPNASGKTTLALTIIGHPAYRVVSGDILFRGRSILGLGVYERARLGIAIAYQNPPEIPGVKLRDLIRMAGGLKPWSPLSEPEERFASEILRKVGLRPEEFLSRDVNVGFSGGERKRAELAQVIAMKPKLMILDEPDSGVDIDSIRLIGEALRGAIRELGCAVLLITHHRHILRYLEPDVAHVIFGGRIVVSGDPDNVISRVESLGYSGLVRELCGS